jgi:hypothetical protein
LPLLSENNCPKTLVAVICLFLRSSAGEAGFLASLWSIRPRRNLAPRFLGFCNEVVRYSAIVLHRKIHETDVPTQWPASTLECPFWYRQVARSSIPAPLADPYRRLHPMPSSWLRADLPETRSLMVRRIWVKAGGPVDMPSMPAPLAASAGRVGLKA